MRKRRFSRLKTAIFERELSQAFIAQKLGRGTTYVSRRMTGKEPFSTADMAAIGAILGLPRGEWLDYFMDEPQAQVGEIRRVGVR